MKTLEIQLDDETAGRLEAIAGAYYDGDLGKAVRALMQREDEALNRMADRIEAGRENDLAEMLTRSEADLAAGRFVSLEEVERRLAIGSAS